MNNINFQNSPKTTSQNSSVQEPNSNSKMLPPPKFMKNPTAQQLSNQPDNTIMSALDRLKASGFQMLPDVDDDPVDARVGQGFQPLEDDRIGKGFQALAESDGDWSGDDDQGNNGNRGNEENRENNEIRENNQNRENDENGVQNQVDASQNESTLEFSTLEIEPETDRPNDTIEKPVNNENDENYDENAEKNPSLPQPSFVSANLPPPSFIDQPRDSGDSTPTKFAGMPPPSFLTKTSEPETINLQNKENDLNSKYSEDQYSKMDQVEEQEDPSTSEQTDETATVELQIYKKKTNNVILNMIFKKKYFLNLFFIP